MSESAGLSVRRRTDRDLDDCVRVLAEVHERDGYPVNWPEQPGGWLTQPSLVRSWVAELDGRIVGHVGLSRSGAGDAAAGLWSARSGVGIGSTAVVNRLFVAPSARGHGIGALLLTRAGTEATERGLHPVLDVLASDTAAVALYERLGWQLLATVEQRWSPAQQVTVHCYAATPVTRRTDPGAAGQPPPGSRPSPPSRAEAPGNAGPSSNTEAHQQVTAQRHAVPASRPADASTAHRTPPGSHSPASSNGGAASNR